MLENIENAEKQNEDSNFVITKIIQQNEKITLDTATTNLILFKNVSIISDEPINVKANYEDVNLILKKIIVEGVEWVLIEIFNYNEKPATVSIILE